MMPLLFRRTRRGVLVTVTGSGEEIFIPRAMWDLVVAMMEGPGAADEREEAETPVLRVLPGRRKVDATPRGTDGEDRRWRTGAARLSSLREEPVDDIPDEWKLTARWC